MSTTIIRSPSLTIGPCPVCAADSNWKFTKFGYNYFGCRCGFVFIWPRPSQEELHELYRRHGEEYWTTQPMVNFAFSPTKSWREIRFVQRFSSNGTLLDLGCSTGSFVKAARSAGFDAEGIDICEPAVRFGKSLDLPLHALDILTESPGKTYELVTMWATVEHLPDPSAYISRAREMLVPGGLLFVSVPNYAGLTQGLLGNWDRYVGSDHLNYFTPQVLRRLLEKQGLRFKGSTTYGFNPILFMKDLRNRGKQNLATEDVASDQAVTLRLKHSPLLHVQRGIERVLNLFGGGDVIAICAQREY